MASNNNDVPANLKAKLWSAADKLRGHMDAAEYKHVVLGLISLKHISVPSRNFTRISYRTSTPTPKTATKTSISAVWVNSST